MNCVICKRRNRAAIEAALEAGEPLVEVAKRFRTGYGDVWGHWRRHVKHIEPSDVSPLDAMTHLLDEALALVTPTNLSLPALRLMERREKLMLLAERLRREQRKEERETPFDIEALPEWQSLKGTILLTLERFPDAYQAMVEALEKSRKDHS
ncbi:MAG: hypothetical protein R2729_20045 [Bryobacteraceae bacterium]